MKPVKLIARFSLFVFVLSGSLFVPNVDAGKRIAVVVGVNDYSVQSRHQLPDLRFAARDAEVLAAALKALNYSTVMHADSTSNGSTSATNLATASNIRAAITSVISDRGLGEDDQVIVSLHGHGVQFSTSPSDETPRFYFCPADANLSGIRTAADITPDNHLISLEELYKNLASCSAATKMLVVDACRNDPTRPGIFRSGMASATRPKLPPPPGGLVAFFSCKPNERAVEDESLRQGVFSHYLTQGLLGLADQPFLGEAPDGVVTLQELAAYVSHRTNTFVSDAYEGIQQTPVMKGTFDANLPLVKVSPFDQYTSSEVIALFGGKVGDEIKIEFVRVAGGRFLYVKGGREVRIPTLLVGQHEVTVGQFRKFVNATGYETLAEEAAELDFDAIKARGYSLGKGESRNGVYEFGLSELFGLGLAPDAATLIRSKKFSWRETGWPQTDDSPVVNLTSQDMYAFQDWVQRSSYRDARIPKEHELIWVCYGQKKPDQPHDVERKEFEDWLASNPPLIREYGPNVLRYNLFRPDVPPFGERAARLTHGTLPVNWQKLSTGKVGGLYSNAREVSENPVVSRDLCVHVGGACLPRFHAPMIAGFRLVIPVAEEVTNKQKAVSERPQGKVADGTGTDTEVERHQLEESAQTSFALASYFQSNTAANRRLGGVIHRDYPTALLAPAGTTRCEVWKSKDGQFVFVSRDNETLRFQASLVSPLYPAK